MKKSLFAVAALTALAGTAQAQSSVSVYGILDAGYIGANQKGTGTSISTNSQTSAIGQSAESTSRLGFKGNEDIGGGLSAFFTVEVGLTPTGGAVTTASTWNNRQSFVGLKKNGIGQFAIGTQYTPVFNAASATSPGQLNNLVGDVIYATNVMTGPANTAAGTGPYGSNGAPNNGTGANNDSFTSRTNSTLSVKTDTFAGFSASAVMVMNNNNTTQTANTVGGQTNNNGWGLSADYTWQKLYVTAGYQALKNSTPGSLAAPAPNLWNGATGDVNVQDNQAIAGATYDFGILKAYAQWVSRKATDVKDTSYYAKRTAQQIGVRSYITPTIEAFGSVGTGRVTGYGQSVPTANFTGYQLGSNYYLSKRTNLYAIFGSSQTSSVSAVAGTSGSGASVNNYAVGVRHTF